MFFWQFAFAESIILENKQYFGLHEMCEKEIAVIEKKHSIPHNLFMAISTVESGRSIGAGKRPYPWTVCARGKSMFFSTKNAAIAAVKKLMASGTRNIDVGCMQVNLLHHGNAFKDLEEAFTPKKNIMYAALFFLELKNTYNSWTHAVGYYHSRTAKFFKPYCVNVYKEWANVCKKNQINKNTSKENTRLASVNIKTKKSFLPSYYSLSDNEEIRKLHQLGSQTLVRNVPKFLTNF